MKNHKVITMDYQNPHATAGLKLSAILIENTSVDNINSNVKRNAKKYKEWLQLQDEHKGIAVLIGGGASINDHIKDIQNLQRKGATVFAMNAASKWAHKHGIEVDSQIIMDAREESATLVDPLAHKHLFSSMCHPKTTKTAKNLVLWHADRKGVEDHLPQDRVEGYVIVGGGGCVGILGMCLVYTQGFREFHVFGYDGSFKNGKGHAYSQSMNDGEPTMQRSWAGKDFIVPMGIYEQPSQFIKFTALLKTLNCSFNVYGEGLLQTMYSTPASELCESEKYELLWMYDIYRLLSPGEEIADLYLNQFKPRGKIIDFGCGTGRASIKFSEKGLKPLLIDFTNNSRDEEALDLPFLQWDLTKPIPSKSPNGFCADVMEHIPTKDVKTVINNIMDASERVFFQISTVDDIGGTLINAVLHNTVRDHDWWLEQFKDYKIAFDSRQELSSLFYIQHIGET